MSLLGETKSLTLYWIKGHTYNRLIEIWESASQKFLIFGSR